ncbi:MAG: polysaccharide deacetylase [Clostridiales bacterium]|nr:polysaccharide deacetylase [Clostridiales bacterium]
MILFDLFPNGKKKVVTFSYDDGDRADLKMVEIFDKYGAKGTFNLVSGWTCGNASTLSKEEIIEVSKGHEIANHTKSHFWNERIPLDQMVSQVVEAKYQLEDIIGKPVTGYAYPNGKYNETLLALLKGVGIDYARTAAQTNSFKHPENFLTWDGTCHHNKAIDLTKSFVTLKSYSKLPIFYVWGHSYEFNRDDNWNVLTEILEILKDDNSIWYATNIEVYEYLTAIKNLRITHGETSVYNPSNISVFATVNEVATEFKPGLTILK